MFCSTSHLLPNFSATNIRSAFVGLALLAGSTAVSQTIPDARRIDWTNTGIPGGIPTYSNISTRLSPRGLGLDDSGPIQTALNAAGPDGVVLLDAGDFVVNQPLRIPSRTVLRGSGSSGSAVTRLIGPGNLISFYEYQAWSNPVSFAVGHTALKGSTSIPLAGIPTPIGPGMHVQIQEDNNPRYIFGGIEGDGGPWAKGQWVEVVSFDSTNKVLTFTPPLYSDYTATQNPRIRFPFLNAGGTTRNFVRSAGVEDLVLVNTRSASSYNVQMGFAAYCWLKNVKSMDAGICHVWTFDTFRCEIRSCTFQGILAPITSSRGYGIQTGTPNAGLPSSKTTALRIEDNIFDGNRGHIFLGYGAAGTVIGYNYFVNTANEVSTIQKPDVLIHSSFPIMNLIEGNIGTRGVLADNFHGNAMWNTVYRNWFKGKDSGKTSALTSVELDTYHREYNVIGNVFGYSGITTDVLALQNPAGTVADIDLAPAPSAFGNRFKAIMLGYYAEGGSTQVYDSNVASSLIEHSNHVFVRDSNPWSSSISTQPSLYYGSQAPTWWGTTAWPPIGPDLPTKGAAMINKIPAQLRYEGYAAPKQVQLRFEVRNGI
jgi:hypothetical protein